MCCKCGVAAASRLPWPPALPWLFRPRTRGGPVMLHFECLPLTRLICISLPHSRIRHVLVTAVLLILKSLEETPPSSPTAVLCDFCPAYIRISRVSAEKLFSFLRCARFMAIKNKRNQLCPSVRLYLVASSCQVSAL